MKIFKLITFLFMLLFMAINTNSQNSAVLEGKKVTVHKIDGKYGPFHYNMGYTYSVSIKGILEVKLSAGEHTIEFAPWYGDYSVYKLVFTAEEGKKYELSKQKGDEEKPQIIEGKTKAVVKDAVFSKMKRANANKNDTIVRLYEGTIDKNKLAVLSLEPKSYDVIPIVYKIDDLWGPIFAGCMWRFNKFKLGANDLRGATKHMTFSIELLPGEHSLECSFHSTKVNLLIKGNQSNGGDSDEIYIINFKVEAGKSYTFKYKDENDASSIFVVEK
jgi:hypothetical protein